MISPEELALVKLARDGDEDAFAELVQAHRGELRAYCYRMLGSLHDAEDALQEALLRAWRGLPGFEGRSSLRSWLYSIAAHTSVDIAKHRSRRELPVSFGPEAVLAAGLQESPPDPIWLEPYPDRWLTSATPQAPEARYEQRESVELAFMVALQQLPPLQRAVLILRDVLGFSASEVAAQLATSAPAVNSALQRARAATRDRLPAVSQRKTLRAVGDQAAKTLVRRYADAIEAGDASTLISMLTKDATWSMPPIPTYFRGHQAVRDFLVRFPLTLTWKHVPARANGQLAVGCYLLDPGTGTFRPAVLDVLTLDGDQVVAVTGFQMPDMQQASPSGALVTGVEIFARFGLPAVAG